MAKHLYFPDVPKYVFVMAVVTLAYLTVEIPFSVHLVRVMGGLPGQSDIDDLEAFGRVLTGVAVAIWAVGTFIFPRFHRFHRSFASAMVVSLLVGSITTYGVYLGLEAYAEHKGASSTAEQRRAAFMANLYRNAVANEGIDYLSPSNGDEWRAFVSVLPAFVRSDAIADLPVETLAGKEAAWQLGGHGSFRQVFDKAFSKIVSAYTDYSRASDQYLKAASEHQGSMDKAWEDFRRELVRNFGRRDRYMPDTHRLVRIALREQGIPVPESWTVNDRAGFNRAYMQGGMERIERVYRKGIEDAGFGYIEPGLGEPEFVAHPSIQQNIRSAAGLPAEGSLISDSMTEADFLEKVYKPRLEALTSEFVAAAQAPLSEFADGGKYAGIGADAVKGAELPALAILLSIAGAMLHVFKFTGYVIKLASLKSWHAHYISRRFNRRFAAAFAITAVLFAGMSMSGNSVLSSNAYGKIIEEGTYARILDRAISIQPEFSILGDAMGHAGLWLLVQNFLPEPRSLSVAAAENKRTELEARTPTRPASKIPVPTPRPDVSRVEG